MKNKTRIPVPSARALNSAATRQYLTSPSIAITIPRHATGLVRGNGGAYVPAWIWIDYTAVTPEDKR